MVGIDPNASRLYDGFRRAQKAGLSNALFVVASAEALPKELIGSAHEVRIQLPWGSLLDAILRADRAVLASIAGLLRHGGTLNVLVSVVESDGIQAVRRLDDGGARNLECRIASAGVGLVVEECREATTRDVTASHSTWAKRLGVGRSRPAWLLQFRKQATGDQ